ncbi:MAG: hypothetical protein ABIU54_12200, partial [Candidatus Eisenbacteria bacterium]
MSISVPTNCTSPECREPAIRPIHRSSRKVEIDAVDGPPVYALHVTYRCTLCGHTWAVQGYTAEDMGWQTKSERSVPKQFQPSVELTPTYEYQTAS